MKYVYFSLLVIFLVICLAFATEFDDSHEDHHDESIHDTEDSGDAYYDAASNFLSSLTKDDVKNHFKDIIRGFSDKGLEDCDLNSDKYLDETEIECFITEKMGFAMLTTPVKVVEYYDTDKNGKLDSDEIWEIVENKNPTLFEILPSTIERNMELLHGIQGGAPEGPGAGIFY
uniref:EF-hand domain-containing protein n=1 Tax=Caenorhabditis tropicalis TaxID=1561998 RepID=A0A1I7TRD6_9PELO